MLAKLEQVRRIVGYAPMLYGPLSGWRSYDQQKALWDAYQNGTGNIASNPDTGNRTHMRGVAADLADKSAKMQAACRTVGLLRDVSENWHWQLSNWVDYPIVKEEASDTQEIRKRKTWHG
jgi:D-alanyl-D-alanine dipeptidase